MAKLSTDLTDTQIKQLNELRAKQAAAERARVEYSKAFQADCREQHLTSKWYEICQIYGAETQEEQGKLLDHICSKRQIDFYNRNVGNAFAY